MDNPARITYFGVTDNRGKRTPFGIKKEDRRRHMYIIGKTGMGKSTLLENLAIQDIRNGEGLAFIDPHGGTAEKLLDYVPEHRIKDVVYFAPFDLDNPIAFNVMEDVGYDKRHLVVSGLMATFKKIWVDAWSARMEYILSNTLLALLEYPGSTLLSVNRMYTDKVYRKQVVENVKDPVVKDFWTKEFATYTDRYTQEATPAIQNKIGQFTSNPLIRNIIGQPHSTFDIRTLMDEKKILIINLSKGLVGETNMRLLGSMLTTRIFLGAMSRADVSEREMKALPDFYFYVDEFQNFANETFAEILSEARKYKLNLTIAHQYVEQMEEEVRNAVFGNVGTTIAFRVGPFDAETLETVFSPEFLQEDLVNLGARQIYLTLMIDGLGSRPFSATTIPPIEPPKRIYKKEVVESSRALFAAKRENIEKAILDELEATAAELAKLPPDTKPQWPKKKPFAKPTPATPQPPQQSVPAHTPPSIRKEIPQPHAPREVVPAQDLKEALRAITQKVEAQAKAQQGERQTAIAQAVSKTAPVSVPPKQHPPHAQQAQQPKPVQQQPQARPAPSHNQAQQPKPQSRPPQQTEQKPQTGNKVFEVSEEELRAIFNDNP